MKNLKVISFEDFFKKEFNSFRKKVFLLYEYILKQKSLLVFHEEARSLGCVSLPGIYGEDKAYSNTSFFISNRNILRFAEGERYFYLVPNGYHFSLYLPYDHTMLVGAYGTFNYESIAKKINESDVGKKEFTPFENDYAGVINSFPRPYHYFYERLPEVINVLKKSGRENDSVITISGSSFISICDLGIKCSELIIDHDSVNGFFQEERKFALAPDNINLKRLDPKLLATSRKIGEMVNESTEMVHLDRMKKWPVIWVSLSEEHRSFNNKFDVVRSVIQGVLRKYPDSFFLFDGLTRPIGYDKSSYVDNFCSSELSLLCRLTESIPSVRYLSLIGELSSVKIKAAKSADYFFSSGFTDSMWTAHFFSTPGVAYTKDGLKPRWHEHHNTSFVPKKYVETHEIIKVDPGKFSISLNKEKLNSFFQENLAKCIDFIPPGVKGYSHNSLSRFVLGLHIKNTNNVGDLYCHPLDYFSFSRSPDDAVKISDLSAVDNSLSPDFIVLGGGAVAGKIKDIREKFPDAKIIAWGVGVTKRGLLKKPDFATHEKISFNCLAYGARDYIEGLRHVACVSCMHPFFDEHLEPSHDVVVYGHSRFGDLKQQAEAAGVPYLDNESSLGFLGVVNFLASGKTIVTNSYHGAYWGTLLGRKVSMIPFGSKFFGLKYMPAIVENLEEGILKAKNFSMALEDAREENRAFYRDVCKLLWGEG